MKQLVILLFVLAAIGFGQKIDVDFGDVTCDGLNFATPAMVTGGADSIVVDFTPDLVLQAGVEVTFIAEAANTGAATFTLDGVEDAINESADNTALEAGDIADTTVQRLVFDGTQWQQISQSGN